MKKSELKQIIKEEIEKVLPEIHSTSNITHFEGKKVFNDTYEDILFLIDKISPGASLNNMLKSEIKSILKGYGEEMMDLGEKLTRQEITLLKKVDQEKMAAE